MDIVREVLDKQVLDRQQRKMGRVDGIILEIRDGTPPRLLALEVGGTTLARRLHPRLGRWLTAWLGRRAGQCEEGYRIPWTQVRDVGIEVAVDAEHTPAFAGERWLREKIISCIPGAG
jgi:sporulation protein YlmC with PRC-barrel domain